MIEFMAAAQHSHEKHDQSPTPQSLFSFRSPLSILTAVSQQRSHVTSPAPATLKNDPSQPPNGHKSIMFAEPESLMSDGTESSRPASPTSITSAGVGEKPHKKAPRPKTIYSLAHPPPNLLNRHKLHLRPKVLLQLHQVSKNSRPKPAFDVVPSTIFALSKLGRAFARAFRGKDKLGPDDIIVVKADQYGIAEDTDDPSSREAVGVICSSRNDEDKSCWKTMICMNDSTVWEASLLPNGAYEFVSTDEHGLKLKCRWVPRSNKRRRSGNFPDRAPSIAASPVGESNDDRKFNFSTINPSSRRHPIIASMNRTSIDVLDSYCMPYRTSAPYLMASPVETPSSFNSDVTSYLEATEHLQMQEQIQTDEALRNLILVTGIWVAFRENWSPAFKYSASPCLATPTSGTLPLDTADLPGAQKPLRTVSMPDFKLNRAVTTLDSPDGSRRSSKFFPKRSTSGMSNRGSLPPMADSVPGSPRASIDNRKTRARRSNSTGSTMLPRFSSRSRSKNDIQILPEGARPEHELAALEERNEPPELAIPSPPILITTDEALEFDTPTPTPRRNSTRRMVHSDYFPTSSPPVWNSGLDGTGSAVALEADTRPKSVTGVSNDSSEMKKEKKKRAGRFRRFLRVFKKSNRN